MKALSVWQPYASLIIAGVKEAEFRSWPPPREVWNSVIAIHASARKPKKAEIGELIQAIRKGDEHFFALIRAALPLLEFWYDEPKQLPLGQIIGIVRIGKPAWVFTHESDPILDNWRWPILSVESACERIPCRGKQGFWDWPS